MIKKELSIFLIVGSLTVLVDFLFYRALTWLGSVDFNLAKAIGFLAGTSFAYFANRLWTFGHKPHVPGSMLRFGVLYASTLGANVLINAISLKLVPDGIASIQLAFLFATAISATLNFVGMKFFVFKSRVTSEQT